MRAATEFADAAASYRGVRWRLYGRSRGAGLDCGGLLVAALADVGITVADSRDYDPRMPDPELLRRLCAKAGHEVAHEDAGAGRVGLCRWRTRGDPRHLVVMLDGERIAHVDARVRGVTIVPASWLDGRLVSVFRMNGLEYGDPWQP